MSWTHRDGFRTQAGTETGKAPLSPELGTKGKMALTKSYTSLGHVSPEGRREGPYPTPAQGNNRKQSCSRLYL